MTTFKVVVRKKRADGFYPVYIRVVHRSRMGYIKTDKLITDKQITKNGAMKCKADVSLCKAEKPLRIICTFQTSVRNCL